MRPPVRTCVCRLRSDLNHAAAVGARFVVLAQGSTAPSSAQVVAGTDSNDVAATAAGTIAVPTASATASTTVSSGLAASTAYDVWVQCQDDHSTPNAMASPASTSLTTLADHTAPVFRVGFPRAVSVTSVSMTLEVECDEASAAYYVVLSQGSPAPSVAQVKAGTDGSDAAGVASGSAAVSGGAGNTAQSSVSSGLTADTTYTVCFMAEDGIGPNTQASTTCFDVTMTSDTIPPSFVSGYPAEGTPTDTTLTLNVQIDETGSWAWVLLPAASTAPSIAQVKAGTDGNDAAAIDFGAETTAGTTTVSVTVTGLTASTSYKWHLVAEDDEAPANVQASTTVVTATTGPDATPPAFQATYPKATAVTDSQFTLRVSITEPGSVPWVLLPFGSTTPTPTQIIAGTDSSGAAALDSGSIACADTSVYQVDVTGLAAATPFDVFLAPRDDEATPNVVSAASKLGVVTQDDATPPSWSVDPAASGTTDSRFTVSMQLNEPGAWYFVVLETSKPAPSPAQVKAGVDGSGGAAIVSFSGPVSAADTTVSQTVSPVLSAATTYNVYVRGCCCVSGADRVPHV